MNHNKTVAFINSELEDIVPGFLERRKNDITNLQKALETDNFEILATVGHSLKGSAGGYGFPEMGELGNAIEIAAKNKDKIQIKILINDFKNYLENVQVVYTKNTA